MTRSFATVSLLALVACAERAPWKEPPPVALAVLARASRSEVTLLEPFEVEVDMFRRADLPVTFAPKLPEGTAGAILLGEEREFGHGFWRRARLSLRATKGPGELALGPFSAVAEDKTASAESESIRIEVRTALDAGSSADVEAPSQLLQVASESRVWSYAAIVGALALLFCILGWVTRRRRALPLPLPPAEPPDAKALRELARWRAASRRTIPEVDAYYVGCSLALRVYLEGRFGLRAPERTTEEFLAEAERGGPLSAEQCITLRSFLLQCDLVKFAQHAPIEEQHLHAMAIAENFVHSTRSTRPQSPPGDRR